MKTIIFLILLSINFLVISLADEEEGEKIVDVDALDSSVKADLGDDTEDFKKFNKKFNKKFKNKHIKKYAANFKKNNKRLKAMKEKVKGRRFKVKMNKFMHLTPEEFSEKVLLKEDAMEFHEKSNSIDHKTAKKLRAAKKAAKRKGKGKGNVGDEGALPVSPVKATTKAPTKATTKAATKATTKAATKATTKAPTKATTKAATKATTKATTKVTTKATTKSAVTTKATTTTTTTTTATTTTTTAALLQDDPLPENFDWRNEGVITPVKNQGECGSCWTFSAAGVLEAQHARKYNKEMLDLAEMQMTCVYASTICDGGASEDAFEYYQKSPGIGLEKDTPYDPKATMTCKVKPPTPKVKVASHISLLGSTIDEIKDALITDGPIGVGIYVNDEFMYYGGGIFDVPCIGKALGGHAMIITGYGRENGTDYWLIKNSWDTEWGEDGYAKFKMGSDLCKVESKRLNQAQIV